MFLSYVFTAFVAMAEVQALVASSPVSNVKGSCQMVQKPNPKKSLKCGWPGPLDAGRISVLSNPSMVADLAGCAQVCHSDDGCHSFGFSNNNTCQLYNKSLRDMRIAPQNSTMDKSTTFYAKGCWKEECARLPKPCVCTKRSTETALIYNGTRTRYSTVFATTTLDAPRVTVVGNVTDVASYTPMGTAMTTVTSVLNASVVTSIVSTATAYLTFTMNTTLAYNITSFANVTTIPSSTRTAFSTTTVIAEAAAKRSLLVERDPDLVHCACAATAGNAMTVFTTHTKTLVRPTTITQVITRYNAIITPPVHSVVSTRFFNETSTIGTVYAVTSQITTFSTPAPFYANITLTTTQSETVTTNLTSTSVEVLNYTITAPTTLTTTTVLSTTTRTVPRVVLTSPTALTSVDADGLSSTGYDDSFFPVNLPFPIQIYGASQTTVQMSVNGYLVGPQGTSAYSNTQLPASRLPAWAFIGYWTDLYIYPSTPQGLYYQFSGTAPTRTIIFEWYTSHIRNDSAYYHFTMEFDEVAPGVVTYTYYDMPSIPVTSGGTVGLQFLSVPQGNFTNSTTQVMYSQYSYNDSPSISAGQRLTYDPATNLFVSS